MKKTILVCLTFVFCSSFLFAQQADADFMRKISPEKKVDLSARKTKQTQSAKTYSIEELTQNATHLETQKLNLAEEITRLEAEGVSPKDAHYAKCKMAQKYVDNQITHNQKLLKKAAKKQ